jgi:hypothetical protein
MAESIRPELLIAIVIVALVVFSPLYFFLKRRHWNWARRLAIGLTLLSLCTVGLIAIGFDVAYAMSESWLFTLVLLMIGAGVLGPIALFDRSMISKILLSGVVLGVLVLHFVDLSPVKPYKRFFRSIREGMTRSEIEAGLHHEFPEGGRFCIPVKRSDDTNHLSFTLDPTDGSYNAEIVSVELRGGKVVRKDYWPD